jgi:hypothetical protein
MFSKNRQKVFRKLLTGYQQKFNSYEQVKKGVNYEQ